MKNKEYLFCTIIFLLLGLLVLQYLQKKRVVETLSNLGSVLKVSFGYATSTFEFDGSEEALLITEALFNQIDKDETIVYIPTSYCRACFLSLVLFFQERNVSSAVRFFTRELRNEIKTDAALHGYTYDQLHLPDEELSDIIVLRKASGYRPVFMKYREEYDLILNEFMSLE